MPANQMVHLSVPLLAQASEALPVCGAVVRFEGGKRSVKQDAVKARDIARLDRASVPICNCTTNGLSCDTWIGISTMCCESTGNLSLKRARGLDTTKSADINRWLERVRHVQTSNDTRMR